MADKPNRFRFRAWDTRYGAGEMVLPSETHAVSFNGMPCEGYTDGDMRQCGYDAGDHPGIVLMQSTGLLDENGVEIFEGDIVKIAPDIDGVTKSSWDGTIFDVKWNDEYATWEFMSLSGGWSPALDSRKAPLVVIGNIYENAELLKV